MAFIVEDGTGLPNATSYVAVQDYRNYYTDRGIDVSSETDAQIEGYLVRGVEFIDLTYYFIGVKYSLTQGLEFPRLYEGVNIFVPQRIKYASIIMANHISQDPSFSPYVDLTKNIKSKKSKAGPVESEVVYAIGSESTTKSLSKKYLDVEKYVTPYLDSLGISERQMKAISG